MRQRGHKKNQGHTRTTNAAGSGRRGFALIVSLSLMAVVMLAVILLASQLRVAVAGNSSEAGKVLSRENARLSLAIAVGNLQAKAGVDRRATARAEILGPANFAPDRGLWTGVWNGEDPSADPVWLVSGFQPGPQEAFANGSVEILPGTAARPPTPAPLEEIRDDGDLTGRFAWWAGGEASAAPVSGGRGGIILYEDADFEDRRSRVEFASPFGVSLFSFFDSIDVEEDDVVLAGRLQRMRDPSELLLLTDSRGDPVADPAELADVRDDLSAASFGVLENPLEGGLKKNLADFDYRDDFLANKDLADFLRPKDGFLSVESGIPDRRTYAGKPFFSPRPVLSEAVLYFGIFHTWSDAKIRVRYHIEGEFWNPYSLPLRFAPDRGSYTRGVELQFTGLPEVDIVAENLNVPSSWSVPDLNDDLSNLYNTNSRTREPLDSWMEISPTSTSSGQPELEPGEVYRVMEPNPARQPRGLARDFDTVRWSGNQKSRPDDEADIVITATHPPEGVTLTVVPYGSGGSEVAVYENVEFDDFEVEKKFRSGPNPFSRPRSPTYTIADYMFAYHFRIKTDETDLLSMRDLQTAVDIREPVFRGVEEYEDLDGTTRVKASLVEPLDPDPSVIIQDDSNLFSLLDQVTDGTVATLGQPFERSHDFGYRKMVLYDVPDGDAISVGQLASLPIHRRAPRSIGNLWGDELNAAFDAYFLSPKFSDPGGGGVLGNPWLLSTAETVAADAGEDDASKELIHGAFNINSTSVDAWRSVLSAPVLTPQGLDENGRGRGDVNRENAFFRLPAYQAEVGDFYMTDAEIQDPERFFAQGIRVLQEEQTDDIAAGIVEAFESRAEPFLTLQDFVNSGIISEAIEDVGSRSGSAADPVNTNLMDRSNVFLDQSDVMARLAPFATTRSDTFRVRAFGESVDPRTGERISTALCEAVVQRTPVKIDESDPMQTTLSLGDSRRFRVISLEWTDET